MVRVFVLRPLAGARGCFGSDLLGEPGSRVLASGRWHLDDPSEQSGRLRAGDSVVADQQLLVEGLVDLAPLLRVAGPVEVAKVME